MYQIIKFCSYPTGYDEGYEYKTYIANIPKKEIAEELSEVLNKHADKYTDYIIQKEEHSL